ncbi:hypothetical protein [Deinococcus aquiradiocola]|uniref:Uncharacterized protein n=1 Tax=Deinococcus aquiradiocola TaxID=393059 RepID=A0A917UL01_9DEIO|nr:hypothetical protein [Deinococcus aquiradiocola]GGJ65393.1 hypothetical protein GCM10008939_06650 [Deinococcus aquiradiocola]
MLNLYPHALSISTPGGLVSWVGFEVPPEALQATEEPQTEVLTLLGGQSLPRVAQGSNLTRLRLASPDGIYLPGDRAALLKGLTIGTPVSITENLTARDRVRVWTNALVWAAPVVTRAGTDVATGTEYYSYQLEFIHIGA